MAVTPEAYGAVGDGSTDDTSAFLSALATKDAVICDGSKVYAVADLVIGGNENLYLNGSTLRAATGARWVVKLTGFYPRLVDGTIEDPNNECIRKKTILGYTNNISVNDTSFVVNNSTNIEEGMMFILNGGNPGNFHASRVDSVAGATIGMHRGSTVALQSDRIGYFAYGAVLVDGAARFTISSINILNTWVGLMFDNKAGTNGGATQGSTWNVHIYGARMASEVVFNNTHDIERDQHQYWGSRTVGGSIAASPGQTNFPIESMGGEIVTLRVYAKTQYNVKVDGISMQYGTDFTTTQSGRTIVFSTPLTGGELVTYQVFDHVAVSIHYDPKLGEGVSGAHKWVNSLNVDNVNGIWAFGQNNFGLLHFVRYSTDGAHKYGLLLDGVNKAYFTHFFSGYAAFPVCIQNITTNNRILFNGLHTVIVPDSEEVSVTSGKKALILDSVGDHSDGYPKVQITAWWGTDFSVSKLSSSKVMIGEHPDAMAVSDV